MDKELINDAEEMLSKYLELIYLAKAYGDLRSEYERLLHSDIEIGGRYNSGYLCVEVDVGKRRYRRVDESSLRCVDTDVTFNKIVFVCERGCTMFFEKNGKNVHQIDRVDSRLSPYTLLLLMCNITVEDIDKLIEAVKEKSNELDFSMNLVKHIITIIKMLTEGRK
jgi:hypothetical protein